MLFTTDQQTLDDLNIFGKFNGKDSVFAMFNRTQTVMGATLLEEMLRFPLSDVELINSRIAKIRYLKALKTVFPFSPAHFDLAEQYLLRIDLRVRLADRNSGFEKRIADIIAGDSDIKMIQLGVKGVIQLFQQLNEFINESVLATGSPFRHDVDTQAISSLIRSEKYQEILKEDTERKIPFEKLAEYDKNIRFTNKSEVRRILRYIAHLDVYIAVAMVALERNLVFPIAYSNEYPNTIIEGFYHPLLSHAVGNTLEITPQNNTIFLTGANMAGKSTFMKSFGIALYLAHAGFPVAASRMEFTILDGIYTTINLPDNLAIGASHFYAEVLRLKKIAQELNLNKKLLVIFDELFRGTNVKDAYDATVTITAAFAAKRDSIFVISTHIIEASDVLRDRCENISFKYLPTLMDGNTPRYTYTSKNGITTDRHGMIIIENEGILEILRNGKIKTIAV